MVIPSHMRVYCMFKFVIRGIPFCRITLTVTPHERYGVTNYRLMYCLAYMFWLTSKKHPNSLIRHVIICNKSFLTSRDYPCRCLSLPFEISRFATLSLQWGHTSIMAFEITSRLTIYSTACYHWEQKQYRNSWLGTKLFVILKSRFEALLLQRPHMSVMKCHTPNHSIVCSTAYPGQ